MAQFNAEEYLISLLRACIENKQPDTPDSFDNNALFKLAQFHSVANTAYYALEKMDVLSAEQRKQWAEIRDRMIMSDILQQTEFELLCTEFSQNGIRFLPLKGILIKALYPQSDFRSMSDIDILIDPENAEKAKQIMLSLGYEIDSTEIGVHDVYHKKPAVSIEIHRELFGEEGEEFEPLFSDPWSKCVKRSETRYEFTDEYFFAFLLAHGIKHYQLGGTGIRTFMDIEIFRRHHKELDIQRIYEMFDSVGSRRICEDFIALSEMWFGSGETNDELKKMAEYIIRGGTYGTYDNQVQYELQSKSKAGYIFKKLFPTLKYMKQHYPILRKAPVLLPVCYVVRIFTKPFINRKQNLAKLKGLAKK